MQYSHFKSKQDLMPIGSFPKEKEKWNFGRKLEVLGGKKD